MVYVFFEGGGNAESKKRLSRALETLIRSSNPKCRVRVFASGSRENAVRDFVLPLRTGPPSLPSRPNCTLLLVDSEIPVSESHSPPEVLPGLSSDTQVPKGAVHLMVECMENWFLADPESCKRVAPNGFLVAKLGNTAHVEAVAKADAIQRVQTAFGGTGAGVYLKSKDGPLLLESLDVEVLKKKAPRAAAFFEAAKSRCDSAACGGTV